MAVIYRLYSVGLVKDRYAGRNYAEIPSSGQRHVTVSARNKRQALALAERMAPRGWHVDGDAYRQ